MSDERLGLNTCKYPATETSPVAAASQCVSRVFRLSDAANDVWTPPHARPQHPFQALKRQLHGRSRRWSSRNSVHAPTPPTRPRQKGRGGWEGKGRRGCCRLGHAACHV